MRLLFLCLTIVLILAEGRVEGQSGSAIRPVIYVADFELDAENMPETKVGLPYPLGRKLFPWTTLSSLRSQKSDDKTRSAPVA